jgi:hypothetical protein
MLFIIISSCELIKELSKDSQQDGNQPVVLTIDYGLYGYLLCSKTIFASVGDIFRDTGIEIG